jgi:hypothetical protein
MWCVSVRPSTGRRSSRQSACQSRSRQLRECGEACFGEGELLTANEPLHPELIQFTSINNPRRICLYILKSSLKSQPEYFPNLRWPIVSMFMIIRPFGWAVPCRAASCVPG